MRSIPLLVALAVLAPRAAPAQDVLVYRVALTGAVGLQAQRLVTRTLDAADAGGASAVILELSSGGGSFDMARLIADAVEASGVPVYALVGTQAWGAAALVALAADSIFVAPGASIGAGRPPADRTLELSVPAMDTLGQTYGRLARRQGAEARVGSAMVAPGPAIPGVVGPDSLLTLDAEPAVALGIAAAAVTDLPALLILMGLQSVGLVTVDAQWVGTTVEVSNHNWSDVRIYILRGGNRFRLGTVTTMNTETFEVPEALLGPGATIQLLADLIGGAGRVTTERLQVEPGLVIQWVIENALSQSSYFVWVRS